MGLGAMQSAMFLGSPPSTCVSWRAELAGAALLRLHHGAAPAAGRTVEVGLDLSASPSSRLGAGGRGGGAANKTISSLLVLRWVVPHSTRAEQELANASGSATKSNLQPAL